MAKSSNTGRTDENLDETSSIDTIVDGVEVTNNVDATSGTTTKSVIGYVESENGLQPIINEEDIYKYVFVGTAGTDRIYRK